MSGIDVVFFDAGETLLRPEPSWPDLVSEVLAERGHDVPPKEVVRSGRAVSHHFRRAADEGWFFSATPEDSHAFWTGLYRDQLAELGIDDPEAPQALYDRFSDPDSYGMFEDTVHALDELRDAGYRLGVISNFEAWLGDLLARLGIRDRFEVLAISGPLAVEKPDPRIFKWAVAEAGVSADRCVHVGDQPYFDAEGAISCGLHGVLLDRYGRWTDLDVDYPRISTLIELPAVVEAIG